MVGSYEKPNHIMKAELGFFEKYLEKEIGYFSNDLSCFECLKLKDLDCKELLEDTSVEEVDMTTMALDGDSM